MNQGIQSFLASLGRYGCYALAILHAAGADEYNLMSILLEAIGRGYIRYNVRDPQSTDNWYVLSPDALMGMVDGKRWSVRHDTAYYVPKDGEIVIERWEYRGQPHFRMRDWDSLTDSQVVRNGKKVSSRVFTPRT
jgi:hypothetical protein